MSVKFDKFVIIETGKYTLIGLEKTINSNFRSSFKFEFAESRANNGVITIESKEKEAMAIPTKFSRSKEDVLLLPYVVVIYFTQYGNTFFRVISGDNVFLLMKETKRLIALAKRAQSKTDDTTR